MIRFFNYLINRIVRTFGGRNAHSHWMETTTTAYLVFNPSWPDPPRKWFRTKDEAVYVANALSKKQPGDSFYILKAIECVTAGPTVVKELPGGGE